MTELAKTPATSIWRKPIPAAAVWIAIIVGLLLLLAASPQSAGRLFARAIVWGVAFLVVRSCRKLFSSKTK
jgi:hypothetical protein